MFAEMYFCVICSQGTHACGTVGDLFTSFVVWLLAQTWSITENIKYTQTAEIFPQRQIRHFYVVFRELSLVFACLAECKGNNRRSGTQEEKEHNTGTKTL